MTDAELDALVYWLREHEPISVHAADAIEQLRRERDEARAEVERLRACLAEVRFVTKEQVACAEPSLGNCETCRHYTEEDACGTGPVCAIHGVLSRAAGCMSWTGAEPGKVE